MSVLKILSIGSIFLSIAFEVNAQTEKGNILLGGDTRLDFTFLNSKLKIDNNSRDQEQTTVLEFSPQIGFFIIDGLALGIELPFISSSETDEDDNKFSGTSIAFTPFARYYFGSNMVRPYLHGQAGFGTSRIVVESGSQSIDDSSGLFSYKVGGGLGIFLNKKVSLDLGLGYSSNSTKLNSDNNVDLRRIQNRIGLEIGIVVFL